MRGLISRIRRITTGLACAMVRAANKTSREAHIDASTRGVILFASPFIKLQAKPPAPPTPFEQLLAWVGQAVPPADCRVITAAQPPSAARCATAAGPTVLRTTRPQSSL